jgi:hypothetical protein
MSSVLGSGLSIDLAPMPDSENQNIAIQDRVNYPEITDTELEKTSEFARQSFPGIWIVAERQSYFAEYPLDVFRVDLLQVVTDRRFV